MHEDGVEAVRGEGLAARRRGLVLDQGLLNSLEDEARWALAKKDAPQAAQPDMLGFIEAGPLKSVRPDAVTMLLP